MKSFLSKIYYILKPSKQFQLPASIIFVVILILTGYTMHIAKVTSYLSDDPKTCINCHVMTPQYNTWSTSSHHNVTNCNSCHVPHNNVFNKYLFKAMDGVRHSTMFALRLEPQAIHIHEAGAGVVQKNCIRCHRDQISDPKSRAMMADLEDNRTSKKCWECHRDLPHGKISSLSSTPNGKIEEEEKPIPDWLKDKIEQEYLQIKK